MRKLLAVLFFALQGCGATQVSVHDPVLAKEGDTWYVFSTGPGITFYSSKDRVHWHAEGRVFAGEPAWAKRVAPDFDGHVWAPDIQKHDGKFYLYYAVSSFGKNGSGIGVTVNRTLDPRSPDYKWEDQGVVLQSVAGRDDWNAIDPNVIEDEQGTPWMAFGSFWSGIKLVKMDKDWIHVAQPQEWHPIAARPMEPDEIEAPFILRKSGWYYLFVSWGLCCQREKSTYHLAVGRARSVTGPYLDRDGKDMMKGGGTVILRGDKDWKALGHNSAYTIDGKDILVLHAYETADKYLQKLKIMELNWDAQGWPVVDPRELNSYRSELLP